MDETTDLPQVTDVLYLVHIALGRQVQLATTLALISTGCICYSICEIYCT